MLKLISALNAKVIWTPSGAALEMQADEQVFHLRKDNDAYALAAIEGQAERELVRISPKDPIYRG